MTFRILTPIEASSYRELRLRALREWPPAFGTPADDEEKRCLNDFENRLVESRTRCLIGAFEDQTLVGNIRLSAYDGSNESHRAYLAGLYVVPERRRLGLGRALCVAGIARAKQNQALRRLNLTVVSGQEAAIALYQSLGFTAYGVEKEVFEVRGRFFDEFLMTLELKKTTALIQMQMIPAPLPFRLNVDP